MTSTITVQVARVTARLRLPRWLGRHLLVAAGGFGLAAAPASGQTPAVVPITAEPSHHFALANSRVRVFDVTAGPRAATLVHRHDYDYLFVTLGDADITSTRTDRPPSHLVLADGAVEYAPGHFAHAVANNGNRPFHNITIELLQPPTDVSPCHTACSHPLPCPAEPHCGSAVRLYTANQWVVDAVTLGAGDTWRAGSRPAPRLVILVSDADLSLTGNFESVETKHRRPGNLIWMPAAHGARGRDRDAAARRSPEASITNAGSRAARFIVVDWAPAPPRP
jgi:hypothetical protein